MAEHTVANLVDLSASPIGTGTLRLGRDDDALRQPLVGVLAPPVRAADSKLPLQLLDETILGAVFVHDDGSHLLALLTVAIHRMHIEGLLSPSDHRLYLGPGGGVEGIVTYLIRSGDTSSSGWDAGVSRLRVTHERMRQFPQFPV